MLTTQAAAHGWRAERVLEYKRRERRERRERRGREGRGGSGGRVAWGG
jgi:hypothetical protein